MSKVIGIYVKFTKTTHLIWSCHMTLASNSKKFYILPDTILNFRKVTKFGGHWLKNKKVTGKKPIGGGKDPPAVLIGLRNILANLSVPSLKIFTTSRPATAVAPCEGVLRQDEISQILF